MDRRRRILRPTIVRPTLLPCTRTWTDDEGAVRFGLPPEEPIVERHARLHVMQRIRREVAVSENPLSSGG